MKGVNKANSLNFCRPGEYPGAKEFDQGDWRQVIYLSSGLEVGCARKKPKALVQKCAVGKSRQGTGKCDLEGPSVKKKKDGGLL